MAFLPRIFSITSLPNGLVVCGRINESEHQTNSDNRGGIIPFFKIVLSILTLGHMGLKDELTHKNPSNGYVYKAIFTILWAS